jgi:EAL domain-containing protein (putative c-di-GMP-specific phosphodiesterase class I)
MSESPLPTDSKGVLSAPVAPLPRLGEVTEQIGRRFDDNGVLGLLLVDSPVLHEIERRHGDGARLQTLAALAGLVREVGQDRLDVDDLVVTGEVGRNEVMVLFFRQPGSAAFYRTEIPGFVDRVRRRVEQRGARAFYPYVRHAPEIWCGTAVAIRNPKYAAETQLRELIEEARDDAAWTARHTHREQRREFTELLLDGRIHSVYEPIVDVDTRTVFGYEALARGPEGTSMHSPAALFATAEAHGLMFELDCLCRASGLKGAVDFPNETNLFLNIMPGSIHDPNFHPDRLIKTLEECRLSPSEVVLEINEQESIEDFVAFRELSDRYRSLGFRFALDDTGSGYAGFEELIELSPEFIKIDRSMVSGVDQDPAKQDVLAALLSMAEKMGARVIGEGLDTLEELEMLSELGIHFGQGWLFGRPTPLRASG